MSGLSPYRPGRCLGRPSSPRSESARRPRPIHRRSDGDETLARRGSAAATSRSRCRPSATMSAHLAPRCRMEAARPHPHRRGARPSSSCCTPLRLPLHTAACPPVGSLRLESRRSTSSTSLQRHAGVDLPSPSASDDPMTPAPPPPGRRRGVVHAAHPLRKAKLAHARVGRGPARAACVPQVRGREPQPSCPTQGGSEPSETYDVNAARRCIIDNTE